MPPPPEKKQRKCPGCGQVFVAGSGTIAQCPSCGRLVLFNDSGHTVAFERGGLRQQPCQNEANRPIGQPAQPEGATPQQGDPGRTSLVMRFLGGLASRWRPYQVSLEQQLIDWWPAGFFTFTQHERWALRAAQREQFGFTQLFDPRLAKYLASRSDSVRLDSLTSLSVPIATQLARSRQSVYLRGLSELDPETAGALARHRGQTLALDGLIALPDDIARTLARHRGRGLSLGGLTHLDSGTAGILAEYRGRIALNGVAALTPGVAAALADHCGASLSLVGIRQLSTEAATALAAYEGDLYLEGLTELAGDLPRAFEAFTGKIKLTFHEIRRRRRRAAAKDFEDSRSVFVMAAVAIACVLGLLAVLAAALRTS